jgi:hypothetical protein
MRFLGNIKTTEGVTPIVNGALGYNSSTYIRNEIGFRHQQPEGDKLILSTSTKMVYSQMTIF